MAAICLGSFVNFDTYSKLWLCFSSFCYNDFCTKADTGAKIKYYWVFKDPETQQGNTKETTD